MISILKKTRGKQDAKTRDEGSYIPLLVKKVLLLHTFYLQKNATPFTLYSTA